MKSRSDSEMMSEAARKMVWPSLNDECVGTDLAPRPPKGIRDIDASITSPSAIGVSPEIIDPLSRVPLRDPMSSTTQDSPFL